MPEKSAGIWELQNRDHREAGPGKSGVEKVSFVDGRLPHSVLLEIFTDKGNGTEIVL